MKRTFLIAVLLCAFTKFSSYADVDPYTVNLDAGLLKGLGGADTMVSDNTLGSLNGSLLLLIDEGANNTPQNTLAPGQYVSGDDIVVGAGGFNSNSGIHDETNTVFSNLTGGTTGDQLALRWFPQITYAQYLTSTMPVAGQNFGTYNPIANGNGTKETAMQCPGVSADNPDCGSVWVVPGPSSTIGLNFFTTDDFALGTQTPSEGYANSTVTAVPEPSTYVSAALSCLGALFVRRKFKNKQG